MIDIITACWFPVLIVGIASGGFVSLLYLLYYCGSGPQKDLNELADWLDEHGVPHPCQYCIRAQPYLENWTPKPQPQVASTMRHKDIWAEKEQAAPSCPVCGDSRCMIE